MLIKVGSIGLWGIDVVNVVVEVNVAARGFPGFDIVGLAAKSVIESRERVKTAIINSGFDFPSNKKITVNLAPADLPKDGTFYDFPIAVGILAYVSNSTITSDTLYIGELSLDGDLRPVKGMLPAAIYAKEKGYKRLCVPQHCLSEATFIKGLTVTGFSNLRSAYENLVTGVLPRENSSMLKVSSAKGSIKAGINELPDLCDVLGQEQAKRALEISAAGGHNIIMTGPPGVGKSMLSKAFLTILPPMTEKELLEVTRIYSAVSHILSCGGLMTERPFRAPHHTTTLVSMVGGGLIPRPGEISLAHRGVLFLDELPEFSRAIIEVLRQPIEDGRICINRNGRTAVFPARFTLLAARNPCPCGYLNHPAKSCVCTKHQIDRYKQKISGPILDRIDLYVDVKPVDVDNLSFKNSKFLTMNVDNSLTIKKRVVSAVNIQRERFSGSENLNNAGMDNSLLAKFCSLDKESERILKAAAVKYNLSARSYFKTIKIARTIADLDDDCDIKMNHIAEALQYREKS